MKDNRHASKYCSAWLASKGVRDGPHFKYFPNNSAHSAEEGHTALIRPK